MGKVPTTYSDSYPTRFHCTTTQPIYSNQQGQQTRMKPLKTAAHSSCQGHSTGSITTAAAIVTAAGCPACCHQAAHQPRPAQPAAPHQPCRHHQHLPLRHPPRPGRTLSRPARLAGASPPPAAACSAPPPGSLLLRAAAARPPWWRQTGPGHRPLPQGPRNRPCWRALCTTQRATKQILLLQYKKNIYAPESSK